MAETSDPQSKSGWQEHQDDWFPLGIAVFRFGIADADVSSDKASPAGANLFSVESFKESRDRGGASTGEYEPRPPTVEQLADLLKRHAGASEAEIDREEGVFRFSFESSGRAGPDGPPWVILSEPNERLNFDLRITTQLEENAPFEGVAAISDDEAAAGARSEGVRFATGLVWRQFMLRAFDRAVKAGRVTLYARVQSPLDDFQRLPSDIWPQLDIIDWENGLARDIQGALYSSIHVADSASSIIASTVPDKSGGQSFERQDILLVEEMRELILRGDVKNVSAAARAVLPKAQKLGTDESAEERLRRAYGRIYPTRQKAGSSEGT